AWWAADSEPPGSASHRSARTTLTAPGATSSAARAMATPWCPTTTTTLSSPVASRLRTARSIRLRPPSRRRSFERPCVTGLSRSERPAARTTPTRGRPMGSPAAVATESSGRVSTPWFDKLPPSPCTPDSMRWRGLRGQHSLSGVSSLDPEVVQDSWVDASRARPPLLEVLPAHVVRQRIPQPLPIVEPAQLRQEVSDLRLHRLVRVEKVFLPGLLEVG